MINALDGSSCSTPCDVDGLIRPPRIHTCIIATGMRLSADLDRRCGEFTQATHGWVPSLAIAATGSLRCRDSAGLMVERGGTRCNVGLHVFGHRSGRRGRGVCGD